MNVTINKVSLDPNKKSIEERLSLSLLAAHTNRDSLARCVRQELMNEIDNKVAIITSSLYAAIFFAYEKSNGSVERTRKNVDAELESLDDLCNIMLREKTK